MRPFRSRLATIEERKNKRATFIYIFLTIAAIVLIYFLGIPTIVKLTGFIGDLKKSNQPIEVNDTTPPAPPRLDALPDATNRSTLEVKGNTEPGASVTLFVNGSSEEVTSDKNGAFSFTISLQKGENTISAVSKDQSGNEGVSSDSQIVVFDNTEPTLEITSPEDGKNYYGALQRQVVIEGKTEEGAQVTINDRLVVVDGDGSFSYATTLQEGDNNFNIVAKDEAGNESQKGITLHFWK